MKRLLATTCAFAILTGAAFAQSSNTPSQTPAQKSETGQTGTTSPQSAQPGAMGTPASQSGVLQRVDGSSLVMTFYTANPADTRATKLIGRSVYNLNNENIGEVNDLIIDNGKTIKAIVVGVGGFLGMGERNVAIAPASIVISEMGDGAARLVVNTTKEDLTKAQAFNLADVDKAGPNAGTTTGSSAPSTKK